MRPVLPAKGGKGAYPYDLNSNFNALQWPTAFKQGSAVDKELGPKPTIQQTLDIMVLKAQDDNAQVQWPASKKAQNALRRKLDCVGQIDGRMLVYQDAADELLNNLGECCAYCEIFNNGGFDVEHGAPKSQFPPYTIVWDNLLLSCKPCNEGGAKGDEPSRAYVNATWLGGAANPTERQYYDEVRVNHYIWPDVDDTAYRTMAPGLFYKTGNGWTQIPLARAILTDQSIQSRNPTTRTVMANVWATNNAQSLKEVACQFVGRPPSTAEARRMIELCKLNVKRTGPSATFDRRMYIRTQAWFTVLAQLRSLRNQDATTFDDAWTAMLETARTTGFYSIWVQVFNQAGDLDPTDGTGNTTFVSRFVTDSNSANYFPNTEVTEVP